jgi:hypothetical protein
MLSVGVLRTVFLFTATESVFVMQTAIGKSTDNMPYHAPLMFCVNMDNSLYTALPPRLCEGMGQFSVPPTKLCSRPDMHCDLRHANRAQ